ncbi:hypothetical protein SAMN00120144_1151 [Hymenobacter roseosalivarius DSM 11622]|uniref:Glycosyltransferase RgtA/B/C/D-like domain-containing protein n=1 Tax=Hymenobacter roseosalivarius DSM 11622 TaxID=645990 RepID=A0A1W1V460_9BACT|nr:hypothetical protein [Hymenobacter roseosalivarius]SMB88076.1 hypothetical protein SAMN00120144_1151 [Hymenobacter roseosalivarius DSM 11622]
MPFVSSFLKSLFTPRRVVGLFFGLLLLTGLLLHRDYGVSVDEPRHKLNAMVNIKYVGDLLAPELVRRQAGTELIPALKGYSENDHGVAFEVPMALLNLAFTRNNPQAGYWLRHLCIFLVFVAGVYALFGLATFRFQSWRWGLLAALLLVLSPRFFAEAFYNAQDIVFMALFTLSVYSLTCFLRRPTYPRIMLHALATALAIDVRILGIMSVAFTLGMVSLEVVLRPQAERSIKQQLFKGTLLYLAASAAFVVAGWPALWEAPLANFAAVFRSMSHFGWHSKVFYFGQYLPGHQIPWHYIPVWIALTTPLPYLVAAGLGLFTELRSGLRGGLFYVRSLESRFALLFLVWLLGPILLVIALHSVVYNGWRHLYFVYPALLLFAVQGVRTLIAYSRPSLSRQRLVYPILLLGGLEVGHTLVRMVRMHPHQQVYFSFLPPDAVVGQFDRDYWGLSYRQGLEWVLAHDPSPTITYSGDPWMLYCGTLLLPEDQKNRLRYIWDANRPEVRYFLTTYHQHNYPHSYPDSVGLGREVHTIRAGAIPILSVYRQQ